MAEEGTLAINSDVEKYAGANASVTSKAETYTNVYIKSSEAIINAVTRYDWVTNYASLSTNTKEILRKATATLAAVFVISYDMSGYTTRIEAENMININFRIHQSLIKILQDQKVVTFLGGN